MDEIRLLTAEDIEVRVAQTSSSSNEVKVNLLLYKNARIDMKILDELYTPMGWRRSHKLIGNNLYCLVEVYNPETKEWIGKEDVGVESNTEAEKGQASDAFKRACVNWGIGRELYTAPKVSVELTEKEYTRDQQGRIRVWQSFSVSSIDYDKKSRTITSLVIVDRWGQERFSLNPFGDQKPATTKETKKKEAYKPVSDELYWKYVEQYANGFVCKSGKDCRTAWIDVTHAGKKEIAQFNSHVESFCGANGLSLPANF